MSLYKPQQRHITIRNRDLHFVSYEAHPADARHHASAEPEMWYLMRAGRRWAVMPRNPDQPADAHRDWIEAFGGADQCLVVQHGFRRPGPEGVPAFSPF